MVYSNSSVQMSPVEKSIQGTSVLSHGLWPEVVQCVWLVKNDTRTKSLKGHMTHALGWEKNSVPVPLTGASRERTSPCCGEVPLVLHGSFQPCSHTWLLGFIRCPTRNMKSEEYNRNQSSCIKEENDVGKAVQSCIWSRPVAYSVVQKGKLPVAICKT